VGNASQLYLPLYSFVELLLLPLLSSTDQTQRQIIHNNKPSARTLWFPPTSVHIQTHTSPPSTARLIQSINLPCKIMILTRKESKTNFLFLRQGHIWYKKAIQETLRVDTLLLEYIAKNLYSIRRKCFLITIHALPSLKLLMTRHGGT
jgi:hypothetical protein